MNPISAKCPNCGAPIDLDIDHLAEFCSMCGSKIMLDVGTIQQLLIAKEQTKQETIKAAETTKRAQLDAEKQIKLAQLQSENQAKQWEREEISQSRNFRRKNAGSILGIGLIVFVFIFGFGFLFYSSNHMFDDDREKHEAAVAELREIEEELEEDIEAGNYDHAIILANKLRLDDHWSTEETEGWNARREEYIRIIQERQQAANN